MNEWSLHFLDRLPVLLFMFREARDSIDLASSGGTKIRLSLSSFHPAHSPLDQIETLEQK